MRDPSLLSLELLRPLLLQAVVRHVPFDGWGLAARKAAALDVGVSLGQAELALGDSAADWVAAWRAELDMQMQSALAGLATEEVKIRARIARAVQMRIALIGDREVERAALGVRTLPFLQRTGGGQASLWRTADAMWRLAGDRATDYNYYSKRAILSAVYAATLLFWLGDESEESVETWRFLDRRLENVMQFERWKGRVSGRGGAGALLSRLGRWRYGG